MLSGLLGLAKSFWLWGLKLSILKIKLRFILMHKISVIKQTILRDHLYKILQSWLSNCDYFIKYFFSCNNDSTISAKIKSSFSVKFRYSEKVKISDIFLGQLKTLQSNSDNKLVGWSFGTNMWFWSSPLPGGHEKSHEKNITFIYMRSDRILPLNNNKATLRL